MKLSSARFDMENSRLERPTLKNYGETVVGGSVGTNASVNHLINIANGNVHNLILTNSVTAFRFSIPQVIGSSVSITLILRQDANGNRKVFWPDSVWWPNNTPPTLTTTPYATDTFEFFTIDGGNVWYGGMVMTGSKSLGSLYAWGSNSYGALGVNEAGGSKSSPTQVGSLTNWASASCGERFTVAIKTDGTLWSWGNNNTGNLGINTSGYAARKSSPTQIGALANWASVDAGNGHSLAVKTDGTLWGFGYGANGAIGDGTTLKRSSPVQVGGLTNWATVSSGTYLTVAIKADGTLWSWGRNSFGQLGIGTTTNRSSPVQVGALTNWAKVSCGANHALAIKTDGTLWSFGYNTLGQLGDGTTINKSSPVQIGSATDWSNIACGSSYHVLATKTSGSLWSFGRNHKGQLGDGTTIDKSSPVQIGALTNWATVAIGGIMSLAVKTDGTLWSFGDNVFGQLGDGTSGNYAKKSSPVQIGALTNWSGIAVGTHTSATHAMTITRN